MAKQTALQDSVRRKLRTIYRTLYRAYGPQHWWPARSATEVVVGTILTQNTAWTNAERAIKNLRDAKALSFVALRDLPEEELAKIIRPSGAFRVKAARLKALVTSLWEHHRGSLRSLLMGDIETARTRLLSIHGIGPETADAILLYAGNRPTFVVDAYTLRILRRHYLCDSNADYDSVRRLFQGALPGDARLFNEYHALLVAVGKKHCRNLARCEGCPLAEMAHDPMLSMARARVRRSDSSELARGEIRH